MGNAPDSATIRTTTTTGWRTSAGPGAGGTVQVMIGYLSGTAKAPDLVVCGGVGYKVTTATPLPDGEPVELHVVTVVRETAFDLYGFASEAETELFRVLLRASGVGPTTAIPLMSQLGAGPLALALARGDHATLTRCKGVGVKKAQTLCTAVTIGEDLLAALGADDSAAPEPAVEEGSDDVTDALLGLGFNERESRAAAAAAREAHPGTDDVQILLRAALASAR